MCEICFWFLSRFAKFCGNSKVRLEMEEEEPCFCGCIDVEESCNIPRFGDGRAESISLTLVRNRLRVLCVRKVRLPALLRARAGGHSRGRARSKLAKYRTLKFVATLLNASTVRTFQMEVNMSLSWLCFWSMASSVRLPRSTFHVVRTVKAISMVVTVVQRKH